MTKIEAFKSNDGTLHDSKEACENHEIMLEFCEALNADIDWSNTYSDEVYGVVIRNFILIRRK